MPVCDALIRVAAHKMAGWTPYLMEGAATDCFYFVSVSMGRICPKVCKNFDDEANVFGATSDYDTKGAGLEN